MKHYEVWQGNHYFFLNGRLMFGSSPFGLFSTIVLIGAPFGLFIAFISPHYHWAYTLLASFLLLLCCIFLSYAALTEPGIIPRCLPPPPEVTPEPPTQPDIDGAHLRYCDTCHIFRPRRAKHCRYCDVCVKEFDHHCPWTGNCIGQRNYRYFLFFILSVLALGCYIGVLALAHLTRSGIDGDSRTWYERLRDALSENGVEFGVLLFTAGATLSLFLLCLYHLNLIRRGETTNEALRGVYKRHINPFHFGFSRNISRVLCSAPIKSELEFLRQDITDESIPGMAESVEAMVRHRNFGGDMGHVGIVTAGDHHVDHHQDQTIPAGATHLPQGNGNGGYQSTRATTNTTASSSGTPPDLHPYSSYQHEDSFDDPNSNLLQADRLPRESIKLTGNVQAPR